jgi:hypothetical protein
MIPNTLAGWSMLSGATPLFVLPFFLIVYLWNAFRKQQRGARAKKGISKHRGFSAHTFSLGLALQNLEGLVNHNVQHVVVERMEEDAEDDDQGEGDDSAAHWRRQLRRIRNGEEIDRLILRWK